MTKVFRVVVKYSRIAIPDKYYFDTLDEAVRFYQEKLDNPFVRWENVEKLERNTKEHWNVIK